MMKNFGNIALGSISNVRKSGDDEGVYFVDVEICVDEGFPIEKNFFCARSDDYASTGKWVYRQIIEGSFEGGITQLAPNVDPQTGLPWPTLSNVVQPISQGAQTL